MIESASELRSHYAEIRRRLRNPPKPPTIASEPTVRKTAPNLRQFKTLNAGRPITGCLGLEPWSLDGAAIPTIENIAKAVCRYYKVSLVEIKSHRRIKYMVRPRFVAMYVCRILTGNLYSEISRLFGNRDHTSALYAVQNIEAEIEQNAQLREDIANICAQFAGGLKIAIAMRAATGRLG